VKIKDKVQKEIEMQLNMIAAKVDEINELAMGYTKDQREENIDHFINTEEENKDDKVHNG
tara:strand:+ start:454 stop:633 length:180 start_codon:yes stop_codon:yes gene_type:complete